MQVDFHSRCTLFLYRHTETMLVPKVFLLTAPLLVGSALACAGHGALRRLAARQVSNSSDNGIFCPSDPSASVTFPCVVAGSDSVPAKDFDPAYSGVS